MSRPFAFVRDGMGRADLHVHPAGWDTDAFLDSIDDRGLDVIAITEHDEIDTARAVVERARARSLRTAFIVGEEITTTEGHLLGLWRTEQVPAGLSLAESVRRVVMQGGVAVAAHPVMPHRMAAPTRLIEQLRHDLTGLEAYNPRAALIPFQSRRVRRVADRFGLAHTGGSDAHDPDSVGRATTRFTGSSPADLRRALEDARTRSEGRPLPVIGATKVMIGQVLDGQLRRAS